MYRCVQSNVLETRIRLILSPMKEFYIDSNFQRRNVRRKLPRSLKIISGSFIASILMESLRLSRKKARRVHCPRPYLELPGGGSVIQKHQEQNQNNHTRMRRALRLGKDTLKVSRLPDSMTIKPWVEKIKSGRLGIFQFINFLQVFVAEEQEISLTKTCRESCDMFDGGYSSIPCEEDDWDCLEEEKDFDCPERRRQGLPCPGKARTLCPYGIKVFPLRFNILVM